MSTEPIAIDAKKPEEDLVKQAYLDKAKRNVLLVKNQLTMHLIKMGKTKNEIRDVIDLVNWEHEITAGAELLEERDKQPLPRAPIQVPIPPQE